MRCFRSRRWLAWCGPLVLTACATIQPPLPPSLDLPKPPADLRAVRKGDQVTLTWTLPATTTDRQTVRKLGPTRICRGMGDLKDCGTPVGQTPSQVVPKTSSEKKKPAGTYTDAIPVGMQSDSPDTFATYAVEVLNTDGHGAGISNQVRVSLAPTLPPPQDFVAEVTAQGVVLRWKAAAEPKSTSALHYVYRVYRSPLDSNTRSLVAEVPVADRPSFSVTDSSFEWEKTYTYRADVITLIERTNKPAIEVEGDDTSPVKVFADDVFPPAVPSGLQAVFSGPGQAPFVDLVWAPVTDAHLAGYNVYRHEEGSASSKVNSELVRTPAYRDTNVATGKHYLYSVSAVDLRGNESARSEEAGETIP